MDQSTNNRLHENWQLPDEELAFQDRLEAYDKLTLTFGITHLHTSRESRQYLLNYLDNMEAMLSIAGLIGRDSLRSRILSAVDKERQIQDNHNGPVAKRGRSLNDWLDLIWRQMTNAEIKESREDYIGAMNALLKVARDCVACLEERLGKAIDEGTPALAEAIRQVTADNGTEFNKKTANGADTPPAAQK